MINSSDQRQGKRPHIPDMSWHLRIRAFADSGILRTFETKEYLTTMKTTCTVCCHHCSLEEGKTGACGARRNINGVIYASNYGKLTALALDPIEKKPLSRFYPGSMILSVGSYGCSLRCPFCQNHEISLSYRDGKKKQAVETAEYTPQELCGLALDLRERGNIGIAFTYNEPLVGWEFVRDTAQLFHR